MILLSETYTYEGKKNWETGKRVTAQRRIKTGDTVRITFLGASEEKITVNTFNGCWDVYDDIPAIGENYFFEVRVNGERTYYGKYVEERYTDASVGTGGVVYGSDHDCIDENQVRKAFNNFKEWLTNGAKDNNYWHGLYVKKEFTETISYGMPGEVVEPAADKAIVSPPGVVVEEGDGVFSVDGIRYEIFDERNYSGGKVECVKAARVLHSAYEGKLEIPAKVMYHRRWRVVTQIADGALSNCPDLVEVSIPATVNRIQGRVSGCPTLTAINVDAANERYTSIDSVVYNKEITEIVCYPEGHGESFDIPSTVKSIGEEFNGCTALRHIVIPQSVTRIGRGSFLGCTGLLEINVPGGDRLILNSFNDCTSLQSITLGEGIQTIEGSFCNCSSLKKLVLPDSLESVSSSSFRNCGIVEDVRFPKGKLIPIEAVSNAFYPWRQDPFFIDGVYYVPCFNRHDQSAHVCVADVPKDQLPQTSFPGVETLAIPPIVEQYGFTYLVDQFSCNCAQFPDLHCLELPETLVGFKGTIPGLKEFVVDSDNPEYTTIDGILYSKDQRKLLSAPRGASLSKLVIPEGVELISEGVFMNRSDLKEVILSNSVREIGEQAFENCTSLCKVHLSKGLEKIGSAAFTNTALTSVVLPASVKDLCQKPFSGRMPFFGCRDLKEFVMAEESGPFTVINGVLYEKSKWGLTLICCPPGYAGNLTIPDGVIAIGHNAFWNTEKLEAIVMPDSIERIESWAMAECKSLKEVVLSRKLRFVDSCAFRECPSLEEIDFTRCSNCYGYDAINTSAFMKNPQLKLILPANLENQRQYFERKMKDQ